MKYFIRTTGVRKLDDSYKQIKYTKLININDQNPTVSFINNLHGILRYLDVSNEKGAILLEDDLELCDNFDNEINKAVKLYSDKIINFFTNPFSGMDTYESSIFTYNQCTYYPREILRELLDVMSELYYNHYKDLYTNYEMLVHEGLCKLKQTHMVYRPFLVQHKDLNSLMGHGQRKKRTIYYKKYLDLLGINLAEARFQKNIDKLQVLLNNDIERWTKEDKNERR